MFRKILRAGRAGRAIRTSRPIPSDSRFGRFQDEERASHERLRLAACRAARGLAEELEQRVMLTAVSVGNDIPLNTGANQLQSAFQAFTQVTKLRQEVDGIHDKLAGAFEDLPLVGTALKDAVDAGTDAFNQVSTTIEGAVNTLHAAVTIDGNDIKHAIFVALN